MMPPSALRLDLGPLLRTLRRQPMVFALVVLEIAAGVATISSLLICRRSFGAYGFTLEGWREGLRLGLLWGVLLVCGGAALRGLGVRHKPGGPPPTMAEGLVYGASALVAVAIFAWVM